MADNPKCYFCNSTKMRKYLECIRHRILDVYVYYCCQCGLIQNYPLIPKCYSSLEPWSSSSLQNRRHWISSEDYEAQQWGAKQFLADWINKVIREYFDLNKKGLIKILDVGCHTGLLLALLREKDKERLQLVGLEPDRETAEWGCRNHNIKIDKGYLEEVKYDSNSFDVVILSEVIEHSADPLKMLEEVKRILRLNGLVFVVVPNAEGIRMVDDFVVDEHMFHFTKRTLNMFMGRVGFIELINVPTMVPKVGSVSFKNKLKHNKVIYYWARRIMCMRIIQRFFSFILKPGMIMAVYRQEKA